MTPYVYRAYGITFAVPFVCPGLTAAPATVAPDVVLSEGPVPRELNEPLVREDRWDAEPGRFLVRGGRRAGRFLVEGGQVTLDRNPGAEEEVLASCFVDEVIPPLLRQRGLLVLHANAALTPRGVVVIAGRSGVGKSTTLTALIERGCAMLADDVTALSLTPDGGIDVMPGLPQVYLAELGRNGLDGNIRSGPAPRRRIKSRLATDHNMAEAPGRLHSIYLLAATETAPEVQLQTLTGFEKFAALQSCIYGPMFADEHPAALPLVEAVMETADIHRLERPLDGWTVADVTESVLDGEPGAVR